MTYILRIIIAFVFCFVSISASMITKAFPSELLFILDCSGSMWGRVDDQPKIVIAKAVLKDLLNDVPDEIKIGLLAYGHREKGNCNDIELVSEIGASRQELIQKLLNLNARGKTPIEKILRQTPEVFSGKDTNNAVILISDGIETCQGNPCGYIKTLNEKGINLTIHVIGFHVTSKADEQLRCIAKEGNGGYFFAGNTKELKNALQSLKESIVDKKLLPDPPVVAEVEQKETKSKRLKLPGPGTVILKPASWVTMPPKYWSLVDAETGEQATRSSADSTRVKPGEYQLSWHQNEHKSTNVILTATVTVKSGEKVELPVDTGLRITIPKGISPPKWWGINYPETDNVIARFSGPMISQVIPAGRYTFLWRQKEHETTTVNLGIHELKPGILNDIKLDMGFYIQAADFLSKPFYYVTLVNQQKKIIGKWKNLTAQLAPSGEYTVIIRPTEHHHNEIVWSKITIPEHGFVDVPIDSGIKFIHDQDAKPP
ncbi:MAG: VWA domain-containing protein, partial [Desulfobacula sp.]|uniref:vWA domain-containing protein n=1 Tax=Desulfobacula sp. TaxID=2593537 RepID=UPI0025C4F2A7